MKATTILHTLGAAAILHVVVSACDTSSNPHVDAAGSVGPDVTMETCAASGYATHLYPGKTAVDLARVQTLGRFRTPATIDGQQYTHWQMAVYTFIRDGAVIVDCHTNPIDEVWFVLP